MGGFPGFAPQASTANPYIGAAADYSSSAAHLAASLRAAADQQAALEQQKQEKDAAAVHQGMTDLASALREGAVPVSQGPSDLATNPATGRPTLAESDEAAAQSPGQGSQVQNPDYSFDPRRTVLRGGVPVYYPTPEEKAAVEAKSKKGAETQDDTNSFPVTKTIADSVKEMYGDDYAIKPGDRLPNSRAAWAAEAVKQHISNGADRAKFVEITQQMADTLKPFGFDLKPGDLVSKDKVETMKALAAIKTPPEKPDASQLVTGYNKPLVFDKATQTMKAIDLPPGVKPEMTPAQAEAAKDRELRQSELKENRETKNAESAQKVDLAYADQHNKYRAAEETQKSVAQGYWDARSTEPGAYYRVPRVSNGVVVDGPERLMPPNGPKRDAVLKSLETLAKDAESKAAEQRQNAAQIRQKRGWGEFAAQQTGAPAQATKQQIDQPQASAPQAVKAAAPASAKPVKNGQQNGRKTATLQNIRQFAASKGMTEAQAVRAAQAEGYSITGQ